LQKKIKAETNIYRELQTALIILIILLSVLVSIVHIKFDRRHEEDMSEISKEVEERKAAEQKLSEMNALKDEFISIAAHELRTPLTVMRGYSELLIDGTNIGVAEKVEGLQVIRDKAIALGRVVDEFLDVSRLESGLPISIKPTKVNISGVAKEVVKQLQKNDDRNNFKFYFDNENIEIVADKDRLCQIFENLIGNAIKYSQEGSSIMVKGEIILEQYKVTIADNGIGMSPDEQKKIFQKYYRVNSNDRPAGGLGIGLYLVKNIIDLHGGKIWVESSLGNGTQFFFTLPYMDTTT